MPSISRRQKVKVARRVVTAKPTRRLARSAVRHPRRTAKVARRGMVVVRHRSIVARGAMLAFGATVVAGAMRKRSKAASAKHDSSWNDSYRTTPTPASSRPAGPTAVPSPVTADKAVKEAETTTPPHGDPLGPNDGAQAASPQVAEAEADAAARKN